MRLVSCTLYNVFLSKNKQANKTIIALRKHKLPYKPFSINQYPVISTNYVLGIDVHDSGVCAGKDCIFVVGGRQRGEAACKFNLETQEWMDLPDMNTSRRCPGKACYVVLDVVFCDSHMNA